MGETPGCARALREAGGRRRGHAVEFTSGGTKLGLAAPGVRAENLSVVMLPEARLECDGDHNET